VSGVGRGSASDDARGGLRAGGTPDAGSVHGPGALIAEDEPLLRERLAAQLGELWPELRIVAQARNGLEALELFERLRPQVAFLDVHMPGVNGIEVARTMGRSAALVFVTAYDRYAVEAFARGAIDYLVKPIEPQRLAETVARLRSRLAAGTHPDLDATLDALAARLRDKVGPGPQPLQWIKASVGSTVRLIPVDEIVYFKSDSKYTLVVWDGGEAVIRKTIRELSESLDGSRFAQVHRSTIVNLARVSEFRHGNEDTGELRLKGRDEKLAVSRSYLGLFQRM
jgi:DNA-binding LytR/AlgR family response regulator